MRRFVLALLLAAPPALAQPALVSEATVDKEVYAAGETITLRYTVRNEGDEDTAIWPQCPYPQITFDTLTSPGDGIFCVGLIDPIDPVRIPVRSTVTWVWQLDPDSLGVPEQGGTQTIEARIDTRCGLDYEEAEPCTLADSASFIAPPAASGPLRVWYAPADADSVLALKRAYGASVTDSVAARTDRISERWLVRTVPLTETVAALDADGVVESAFLERQISSTDFFATPTLPRPAPALVTAPAPNPTGGAASFTVRPARTERVRIEVLDALGRRVTALHDGSLAGGVAHRFVLTAEALPAGVYVVRVVGEGARASRRVVVR